MRPRVTLVVVPLVLGLGSCAKFHDVAPDSPDSGGPGASAGVPPGGSFEDVTNGCGDGWVGERSAITTRNEAVKGASSCMMCSDPTLPAGFDIYLVSPAVAIEPPSAGARYVADAWVRLVSGPAPEVDLIVDGTDADGGALPQDDDTPTRASSSWQALTPRGVTAPSGARSLVVTVHMLVDVPTCLEVDAVTLAPE